MAQVFFPLGSHQEVVLGLDMELLKSSSVFPPVMRNRLEEYFGKLGAKEAGKRGEPVFYTTCSHSSVRFHSFTIRKKSLYANFTKLILNSTPRSLLGQLSQYLNELPEAALKRREF